MTNEFLLFSLFENTPYFTNGWKSGGFLPTSKALLFEFVKNNIPSVLISTKKDM